MSEKPTYVRDAVSAIVEFVQGHTGLRCEDLDYRVLRGGNSDIHFIIDAQPERLTNVHPTAMFIESVKVEIQGMIDPSAIGDALPNDHGQIRELPILIQNDIAYVCCRFLCGSPNGGKIAGMRNFAFRNGFIRHIS